MTGSSGHEQRKPAKAAALGGLLGLVIVGVVVALLGSLLAVLPLVGAAVLLVLLYSGRLGP